MKRNKCSFCKMQISGHWTVKRGLSSFGNEGGEREQCSKCACWSGEKKIFQILKVPSASFVLPALSSKPRKWTFSFFTECSGWGWRRWSQNMVDVCKQSDLYSWLLSASCLQQTSRVALQNLWEPFGITQVEEQGHFLHSSPFLLPFQ